MAARLVLDEFTAPAEKAALLERSRDRIEGLFGVYLAVLGAPSSEEPLPARIWLQLRGPQEAVHSAKVSRVESRAVVTSRACRWACGAGGGGGRTGGGRRLGISGLRAHSGRASVSPLVMELSGRCVRRAGEALWAQDTHRGLPAAMRLLSLSGPARPRHLPDPLSDVKLAPGESDG